MASFPDPYSSAITSLKRRNMEGPQQIEEAPKKIQRVAFEYLDCEDNFLNKLYPQLSSDPFSKVTILVPQPEGICRFPIREIVLMKCSFVYSKIISQRSFKQIIQQPSDEQQFIWKKGQDFYQIEAAAQAILSMQVSCGDLENIDVGFLKTTIPQPFEKTGRILEDTLELAYRYGMDELEEECIIYFSIKIQNPRLCEEAFSWVVTLPKELRSHFKLEAAWQQTFLKLLSHPEYKSDMLNTLLALVKRSKKIGNPQAIEFFQSALEKILSTIPLPIYADNAVTLSYTDADWDVLCQIAIELFPVYGLSNIQLKKLMFKPLKTDAYSFIKKIESLLSLQTATPTSLPEAHSLNEKDLHFYTQLFLKNSKSSDDLEYVNAILDRYPNNICVLCWRSDIHFKRNMIEECLRDINKVLERAPNDPAALFRRANVHYQQARYELALKDLDNVIKESAEANVLILRATIYISLNKKNEALYDLNRALVFLPSNLQMLRSRGVLHVELSNHTLAFQDFNEALKIDPNDIVSLKHRAALYRKQNNYTKALQDLDAVLKIEPSSLHELRNRGDIYRIQGKYEEALEDLNHALKMAPLDPIALRTRGDIYRLQNKLKEALGDLTIALNINPDDTFALNSRADVHRLMGNSEAALLDIGRAIKLQPNESSIIYSRACIYLQLEKNIEALLDLNQVIANEPHNILFLGARAKAYLQLRQYKQAERNLKKALEINPNEPRLLSIHEELKAQEGKEEEN